MWSLNRYWNAEYSKHFFHFLKARWSNSGLEFKFPLGYEATCIVLSWSLSCPHVQCQCTLSTVYCIMCSTVHVYCVHVYNQTRIELLCSTWTQETLPASRASKQQLILGVLTFWCFTCTLYMIRSPLAFPEGK